MKEKEFSSFEDFWPYYLSEHSKSGTRALHAIGTTAGLACAVFLLAKGKYRILPLALIPGYGAAWMGHYLIERNRPATFKHPLWSFVGDYRMLWRMMSGKIGSELARIPQESAVSSASEDP